MNTGTANHVLALENDHINGGSLFLIRASNAKEGSRYSSQRNGGRPGAARHVIKMESSDEPPAKKPRRDSSTPGSTSSQPLPDFKAQVRSSLVPHVALAVRNLSADELDTDAIGVKAVALLARGLESCSQLSDDSGLLTPWDDSATVQHAAKIVKNLSLLHQFKLKRQPADAPAAIKKELLASNTAGTAPAFAVSTLQPPPPPKATKLRLRKPYKPRVRKELSTQPAKQWMQLTRRPYLSALDRDALQHGTKLAVAKAMSFRHGPAVYHVDFSAAEIANIIDHMAPYLQFTIPRTATALSQLCTEYPVSTLVDGKLPGRTEQDIRSFCSDLLAGTAADVKTAKILSIHRAATPQNQEHRRQAHMSSLLFARELEGHGGMGRTRRFVNFQSSFKQIREDALDLAAEFTNCAGDISTIAWIPHQNVLCGTTAHSDAHNQQYNRPGNLLLCSTSRGVLRAFPDHRVPRPIVTKGENSSAAMRQSQDPWLYSSVVSSDYDAIQGIAYTSSFDKTFKAWKVDNDGGSMEAVATFQHDGIVNFVAAAKDGSGRVATAADVTEKAIRIYTMNPDNMAESPYYTISCSRNDADGSDKWAYFPATVQWGIAPGTQHLLLVGYSPRSYSIDEQDIPADKMNTGEILLWDAEYQCRIPVMTATTANVFEVAWHPTVCGFAVGTSPCGLHIDNDVRTQVHVFRQDMVQHPDGAYSECQKLDCLASDINELTITPNSMQSSYVTAACTDGKVYVWDMAQGDKPIHILKHGTPLEEVLRPEDREREDTGVKFTAWGSGLDRLYTGSSDGVVKVWNIRNRRKPFVRDLLRAPGPISCGRFSPDHTKLAIGDATGRLFIFSVTKDDKLEEQFTMVLPGTNRRIRRPKPFIPHPEPPPPPLAASCDPDAMTDDAEDGDTIDAATYARRRYLETQQVVIHANPVIGAVKGPQYAATGLFHREAHLDDDPSLPLVTKYERMQQESRHSVIGAGLAPGHRRRALRRLVAPPPTDVAAERLHRANVARDFDVGRLDDATLEDLVRAGALLDVGDKDEEWGFIYEDSPATF